MNYHFKFNVTPEEFEEYTVFTAWEAPWTKKTKRKFIINNTLFSAFVLVAILTILRKVDPPRSKDNYLILALFFLVGLFIAVLLNYLHVPNRIRNKARKLLQKEDNQKLLIEREMELTDEQIIVSGEGSVISVRWDRISKYAASKNHFFLYLNTESAYVIPKRLFSTQQELVDFDKFLTQKVSLSSSFRAMGI